MRRSALLVLLVVAAAAVLLLLLQMGGGVDRAGSRRNAARENGADGGGESATHAVDGAAGDAAAPGGGAAARDDDPNRVPGPDLVLSGRVVRDDRGVEEATVVAVRAYPTDATQTRWVMQSFETPPPPIATTASGKGGRFELRIPRRSRVILRAAKPGNGAASLFLLVPPEGDPPEVTLRLRPAGTLEGIVVDEKDEPVKDANVALGTQDWTRPVAEITARTDAEGRFVLEDVPDGSYRIRAQAASYPEARHWASVPSQKFVRIQLRAAGVVTGTVTAGDGKPVEGARVMLQTSAVAQGGVGGVGKGETDANGAYRIEIYPGSMQTAVVDHPHYGRHVAGDETFDLPTALVETGKELAYDIRLRKGVAVRGVAVFAESQAPAAGTTVTLLRMASRWRGMAETSSVRADDEGRFEFAYVTEGTYGLEAKGEWGARLATRNPQPNQRVTIDFFVDGESPVPEQRLELVATGGVRGRILGIGELEQGQRPNVYLQTGASFASGTVDDLGSYEILHVPPADNLILQSNNPQAKSDPFRVEAGKIAEVDLDAKRQGVTGIVVDEKGEPIARARVYLCPQSQVQQQLQQIVQYRGWGAATTDEQGRFTANTGQWQGEYWAKQKFVAVSFKQGYGVAVGDGFDLPGENAPSPELRLVLPSGGTVRGRVEHAGGAAAPNASVTLSPKKDPNAPVETRAPQTVYTDLDGRFEFTGVGDGVYLAFSYHPEGKVESREVRAGAEGVKLVIEPALAIGGVVVTEDGRPVSQAQVSVLVPQERGEQPQMGGTQANGRFRIGQLAAGTYAVEVFPNQQQWGATAAFEKKRVEGVSAGTEDLVIVVSEGKALRGKVEDGRGQPVAGAGVIALPLQPEQPQSRRPSQQQMGAQSQPSAVTNGRGEFEIKGVGSAEVEVLAVADGYTPATQRAVAGGAPVILRLEPGAVIEGRLLKSDGTPAARQWLWLQPLTKETNERLNDWQRRGGQAWNFLGGWNMQSGSTDADGRFRFTSLLPGEYRVQTQAGDDILAPTTLNTGAPSATLRMERALTIRGRVTGADGRPIVLQQGQRVYINARRENQWFSGTAVGDDGTFELRGMPPGNVTLQVWAGNEYKPATVEAVSGSDGVSITLERNEAQPRPPGK